LTRLGRLRLASGDHRTDEILAMGVAGKEHASDMEADEDERRIGEERVELPDRTRVAAPGFARRLVDRLRRIVGVVETGERPGMDALTKGEEPGRDRAGEAEQQGDDHGAAGRAVAEMAWRVQPQEIAEIEVGRA